MGQIGRQTAEHEKEILTVAECCKGGSSMSAHLSIARDSVVSRATGGAAIPAGVQEVDDASGT